MVACNCRGSCLQRRCCCARIETAFSIDDSAVSSSLTVSGWTAGRLEADEPYRCVRVLDTHHRVQLASDPRPSSIAVT